jgi:hypothetical protein
VSARARAIGIAALLLAIVIAFALRGGASGDSPDHRTDSDGVNGASALVQLAGALGHPTTTLEDSFAPDLGMGALFVLSPAVGFSTDDTRRVLAYVSGGGVLVYAAELGDPQLDAALHVSRVRSIASGDATAAGPALAGVSRVAGAATAEPLDVGAQQVLLLRSTTGQPLAFEQFVGRGRIVVLADPLPLCNGYLEQADDWRLASDLLSLAPAGTAIAFDEFHHDQAGPSSPLTGWLSTAWGAAVAWLVLIGFAGLLLRGRAFGPRLEPPGAPGRSSAEHVAAVGGLLERSRAAAATGRLLTAATRRALGARHGLTAGPGFAPALGLRAPAEAAELAAAEAELDREEEAALAAGARRLHRLAYPPTSRHDGH